MLVVAMLCTCILTPVQPAEAASSKVSTKQYTISKKAGTYSKTTKITITAKKGYKVYYTTGSNLTTKKVIKSGKKKTLTIKKTTTLKLYAVKKNAKVTAKALKSKAVKRKTKSYKYKIKTATSGGSSSDYGSDSSGSGSGSSGSDSSGSGNGSSGSGSGSGSSGSDSSGSGSGSSGSDSSGSGSGSSGSDSSGSGNGSSGSGSDSGSDSSDESDITVSAKEIGDIDYTIDASQSVSDNSAFTVSVNDAGPTTVSINSAGTYYFSGSMENVNIVVNKNEKKITDTVALVLDNLTIDNSSLTSDDPVISIGAKTADVVIAVSGQVTLKGAGSFATAPASAIVYADDKNTTLTMQAYEAASEAEVTVTDSMASDTDYNGEDPSDGICAKGTLVIVNGTYNITTNGDCLKGSGSKGNGGVTVGGGTLNLTSNLGNAIKSKNGAIQILGGTVNSLSTAEDAINAKNYTVNIKGGTVNIDKCFGDGIQGENVNITGGNVDIKTHYEYAGKNFYDTSLGSGNYNSITSNGDNNKTETVYVDTGSHKGIKAGTKAKTFTYASVSAKSDYTAGVANVQEASGGLTITGGTINIDTTKTGIKYNASSGNGGAPGGGMGGGGSSTTDSNGQMTATSDGQYIIGAPEDGIHSNNTTVISGGTITIAAADDGIASSESLYITGNNTVINITTAYEGIESGEICIGKTTESDTATSPTVTVKSNDDGINAAKKTLTYSYADEDEETYTKKSVAGENNTMTVYGGTVTVSIDDESSHTVTLPYKGQSDTSITFTSDGDGIDCNGSFYAKGGKVIVFGAASNGNGPIDMDNDFEIAAGATVLAIASSGSMTESPTSVGQAYITTSSGGGMGGGMGSGMGGGRPGGSSSSVTLTSGGSLKIYDTDGSTELISVTLPNKSMGYLLFSTSGMTNGSSYKVVSGSTASLTATTNVSSSSGGSPFGH